VQATGGGRQASGMSRGTPVHLAWDGAEDWSMAADEAANIEETGTRRGRRGREVAAWWTWLHRGAAGSQCTAD